MQKNKKWRKILYEDQGVPDNYVDESFLDEMKKNLYIRTYEFWPVVREAGVLTQQICSVCLFVVAFIYMDYGLLSPSLLFCVICTLSICGYLLNDLVLKTHEDNDDPERPKRTKLDDIKSVCLFLGFGYGLSPVFMTLTDTISTDTIYAMTVLMLLANLLFHDYGAGAAVVCQPLSLNAALFASVCLASRLPTMYHAFVTVTSAVVMFALWPVFRKRLRDRFPASHLFVTVFLGACTSLALYSVSTVGAVMFILGHLFVTFVCPAWLIRLQPYKNNIYGPWDEAMILD